MDVKPKMTRRRLLPKHEVIRRALVHAIHERETVIVTYIGDDREEMIHIARIELGMFKELLGRDYARVTAIDKLLANYREGKIRTVHPIIGTEDEESGA